jgi:hypothetical protein
MGCNLRFCNNISCEYEFSLPHAEYEETRLKVCPWMECVLKRHIFLNGNEESLTKVMLNVDTTFPEFMFYLVANKTCNIHYTYTSHD